GEGAQHTRRTKRQIPKSKPQNPKCNVCIFGVWDLGFGTCSSIRNLAPRVVDFLLNGGLVDLTVSRKGTGPGGYRVLQPADASQHLAEMVLNDGVAGKLFGSGRQIPLGLHHVTAPEVCPPQAVEIRRIPRFDIERALDEANGLVKLLAILGEKVAEVIERFCVGRIDFEKLPERALCVGVP